MAEMLWPLSYGVNINIITDTTPKDNTMFDAVLANPPFAGTSCMHQQFFNKAVESMVVDGGQVCIIQPATQYLSKKPHQNTAIVDMRRHVLNNTTKITMKKPAVFENAHVALDLSVTCLTKDNTRSNTVNLLTYTNGDTYTDIDLKGINPCMMEPETFQVLYKKVFAHIAKVGCIQDKIITSGEMFRLTQIRGNPARDDFYTFISRDRKYWTGDFNHGLEYDSEIQVNNIASYLKTYLARFALSLYKFNNALIGALASVPLVDFDQEWSDDKLKAEWGITDEEYIEILKVIPKYYDI